MAAPTDTQAASTASSMQVTEESLTTKLTSALNASHVQIEDMSGGCGQAFNAVIVSEQFKGKTLLQRHRLVNGVLKEEIKAIHAWTPRCLTGEQWERELERGG